MAVNYFEKMEAGRYYHVYNRTNNQEVAFKCEENYRYFLEKVVKYLSPCLDICAYCLMPTHFHFVVNVKDDFTPNQIEEMFRCLLMSYTKAINKKYERNGSLWQPKFRRTWLQTTPYIMEKICYVHHNPIHHAYTANYGEWRYSSFNALFLKQTPTNIARERVFEFADKQTWLEIHQLFKQNYIHTNEDD